jgi:GMP synthase (glutamine-hydrolysing)
MRVLTIENYPQTTLGLVGTALANAGATLTTLRMHAGDQLPHAHHDYDALILLGGAQSAVDDAAHPYLPAEAGLARAFGEAGKAVLGICLGAQLVARAYGAENILGRPLEFGWREVRTTAEGRADPVLSAIGTSASPFHWHLDTFTLPPGAVRLAESDQTAIQAFRIGAAVYGIQFHFEAGTEVVAEWTRAFADEIRPVTPDWFERHPAEAARYGGAADMAGLALAEAWIELAARQASSRRALPAKARRTQSTGVTP